MKNKQSVDKEISSLENNFLSGKSITKKEIERIKEMKKNRSIKDERSSK